MTSPDATGYGTAIELSVTPHDTASDILAAAPPHLVVGVEEHPQYKGCLIFQPDPEVRQDFYAEYSDWLSRYLTLNDSFLLGPFIELLRERGFWLVFMPSCEDILADYRRWSAPLTIDNFRCPNDGALFGYQTFGLRRALERSAAQTAAERLFFVNWSAGAGKSLFACAGAQELMNWDRVDVVLAVTTAPLKENLMRFFRDTTELRPVIVDGTAARRRRKYEEFDGDVLVLNYDRFRVDEESIQRLTDNRRVLFIFDEVQKILAEKGPTLTRKAVDRTIAKTEATIWPMSASVVRASPLRWRDVFSLDGSSRADNPLGTKSDFERRYVASRKTFPMKTKYGGTFEIETLVWNLPALHEVRHRIADRVHSLRKTDPAIRDLFKGLVPVTTPVQLSRQDQILYDMVKERADVAYHQEEGLGLAGYAILLRHICNNPLALLRTDVEYAADVIAKNPKLITSANSVKLTMLVDQLEGIRDAGDKAVLFTQWVPTSLELIEAELQRRSITLVTHHGGMTRRRQQDAVDRFRADPGITCFLSSDAGAFGLNFPEARYVISYEPTFSWDILMQRSERINRADSQLDGLTAYTFVTDETCEVDVAVICEERRLLASTTQGTVETLHSGGEELSASLAERIIFGRDS